MYLYHTWYSYQVPVEVWLATCKLARYSVVHSMYIYLDLVPGTTFVRHTQVWPWVVCRARHLHNGPGDVGRWALTRYVPGMHTTVQVPVPGSQSGYLGPGILVICNWLNG